MTGSPMSMKATSGRSLMRIFRPSAPFVASRTSCPSRTRNVFNMSRVSSLSSITSTRRCAVGPRAGRRAAVDGISTLGSRITNVLPRPGPLVLASTLPPCSSVRVFTRVSPMPSPPSERAAVRSPWKNRSKIRGRISSLIPIPSSSTTRTAVSASARTPTRIARSTGVNFTAFVRRLTRICSRRVGSTLTPTDSASTWTTCGVDALVPCTRQTACRTASARSRGRRLSVTLPVCTRAASRRSSTRRLRWRTCRSITARACPAMPIVVPVRFTISVALAMAARGLRSSCPSMARKSAVARSALDSVTSSPRHTPCVFLRAAMKPDSGRARQASFHPLRPRAATRDGSFRRISSAPNAAVLRSASRDACLVRDAASNTRPPPQFQFVNSCGYVDNHSASSYAAPMKQSPLTLRRWGRVEYERLVDLGAFENDPVELIGGQLIVAEPKGSEHATAVDMADDALRAALPAGWMVRGQNPLALDDESAPEPDIAIVPGRRADYRHTHPARPVLIIEVAESSLGFDRVAKGSLYARAGIVDYWIVNLVYSVLEVYRDPGADVTAPYGWRSTSVQRFTPPSAVAPLET